MFAVAYIIFFAGLLSIIPVDLQGQGDTVIINIPVDPTLTTGFIDYEDFQKSDFSGVLIFSYVYDGNANLMGYDFECIYGSSSFWVASRVYWGGFLWLGAYDPVIWTSNNGTVYNGITFDDLDNDMTDGSVRYELTFTLSGKNAGGFIFYYNTTTYTDSSDAWDNDALFLVHGIGFTATTDTTSLLLALLFLQVPDIPVILQLFMNTPFYASIGFVIWFLIKESLPFV